MLLSQASPACAGESSCPRPRIHGRDAHATRPIRDIRICLPDTGHDIENTFSVTSMPEFYLAGRPCQARVQWGPGNRKVAKHGGVAASSGVFGAWRWRVSPCTRPSPKPSALTLPPGQAGNTCTYDKVGNRQGIAVPDGDGTHGSHGASIVVPRRMKGRERQEKRRFRVRE